MPRICSNNECVQLHTQRITCVSAWQQQHDNRRRGMIHNRTQITNSQRVVYGKGSTQHVFICTGECNAQDGQTQKDRRRAWVGSMEGRHDHQASGRMPEMRPQDRCIHANSSKSAITLIRTVSSHLRLPCCSHVGQRSEHERNKKENIARNSCNDKHFCIEFCLLLPLWTLARFGSLWRG